MSPRPSPEAWGALQSGALLVQRSSHAVGLFHGAGAAAVLNGLVTNDVASLALGGSCYAAALSPKGKVLADLRVLRREDGVLVDIAPAAAPGWWAMIRKYVNPRLARFEDLSAGLTVLDVAGPRAAAVVATAFPDVRADLPPGGHVATADPPLTVLHTTLGATDAWTLYAPVEVANAVAAACVAAGAVAGDAAALEVARIEAGRPAWGQDMDDATLTQEARLDERDAVSYTKGCYTGQETVARLHFRGHVNRLLRGLRAATGDELPRGAALVREDGSVVGDVRSSVHSPRLGLIALAMVRREVEPGAHLVARAEGSADGVAVELTDLPFPT